MSNAPKLNRRIRLIITTLTLFVYLMVADPLAVLAVPLTGQGGGTTPADNSPTVFIIIGLLVVLVAAGVGLVLSRRKK